MVERTELQQQSRPLSRRPQRAADVFGVILVAALAWLPCLARRADVSEWWVAGGGRGHWVTQIAPEGDQEFDLDGTREDKMFSFFFFFFVLL